MKSYANPMKQNFISGTLLLTLTGILSRIIGFYYKYSFPAESVQKDLEFTS